MNTQKILEHTSDLMDIIEEFELKGDHDLVEFKEKLNIKRLLGDVVPALKKLSFLETQNDLKNEFGTETDGVEEIDPEDDNVRQVVLKLVIRKEFEDASVTIRGSNAELKAALLTMVGEVAEATGQEFGELLHEIAIVGMFGLD